MAFVEVVPTGAPQPQEIPFSHLLYIRYDKPEEGAIVLYLSAPCKKMVVENIYGKPWESLQATEIDDCLLELLNVLAGNYLNERNGGDKKHHMSLPELLFDEKQISEGDDHRSMWFDAEGIPFRISLRVNSTPTGG
jgi:hypothetical protein